MSALKPINLGCPKCGGTRDTTYVWHFMVNDYLKCKCTICGYEWQMNPADHDSNQSIPDGDLDVTE